MSHATSYTWVLRLGLVDECHCRHVSIEVCYCSWTFFRVSLTIDELACQAMLRRRHLSMACSTYDLGCQQCLACKNSVILLSGCNLRKFHQVWSPISGSASIYLHISMHTLMSFHLLSSDNILHLKFKFALCSLWFEANINWMVSICAFQFNLDFILISIWIHQLLNGQINMLTCPFDRLSKVRSWTWQTQVWTGLDPKCLGPGLGPAGEWTRPRVWTRTEPCRE